MPALLSSSVQSESSQRVWFITGTSSGFGRNLVLEVLARGDRVIATARCFSKLQQFNNQLSPDARNRIHLLQLDVTAPPDVLRGIVDKALRVWGRIDVVVNNAGYGLKEILEEGGSAAAMAQFQTNVFGVVNVTNAVLPHMRDRRDGTIVIVGSRSAWKADLAPVGFYAASKASIHAIGETYATELAAFSIRVLVVAPGSFRTDCLMPPVVSTHRIAAYDALRATATARFASLAGRERGDPAKAMRLVVDVVRGEGLARGRKWPGMLVLGGDAYKDLRSKYEKVMGTLREWEDVATDLEFED